MNEIIIKYLQQPSNEGRLLGLFVLTKKYEYLINHHNSTTSNTNTNESNTKDIEIILKEKEEYCSFYRAIGPTFFTNYLQYVETDHENATIAQMLLTLLQLFIHSDDVIQATMSYPLCFSLLNRLFAQPELKEDKATVLNIIVKLLKNNHIQQSERIIQSLPLLYSLLSDCELIRCYGEIFTLSSYSSHQRMNEEY